MPSKKGNAQNETTDTMESFAKTARGSVGTAGTAHTAEEVDQALHDAMLAILNYMRVTGETDTIRATSIILRDMIG